MQIFLQEKKACEIKRFKHRSLQIRFVGILVPAIRFIQSHLYHYVHHVFKVTQHVCSHSLKKIMHVKRSREQGNGLYKVKYSGTVNAFSATDHRLPLRHSYTDQTKTTPSFKAFLPDNSKWIKMWWGKSYWCNAHNSPPAPWTLTVPS